MDTDRLHLLNPTPNDSVDLIQRKVQRRQALEQRPHIEKLEGDVICVSCGKRFPWEVLAVKDFSVGMLVDGHVYCRICAKTVAIGMQKLLIGKAPAEVLAVYAEIQRKAEMHEQIKKFNEEGVVDEFEYEDADKMKKALRNRDGSMETKTTFQKLRTNVQKFLEKADTPKIITGGSNV